MSIYGLQPVRINHASNQTKGLTGANFQPRIVEESLGADGTLHRTLNRGRRTAPMVALQLLDLAALVTLLSNTDAPSVALDGTNGCIFAAAKAATDAVGHASGSVHKTIQIARGAAFLKSLTWSPGNLAVAAVDVYGKSADGTTQPWTEVANAALQTQPVTVQGYHLTALTLNSVDILPYIASLTISIDPQAENSEDQCYTGGLPHPTRIATAGANGPVAVSAQVELLDLGATIGAGDLVATFTLIETDQVALGSSTVVATLKHCYPKDQGVQSQQGSPATRSWLLDARFDGTTKPFAWAAA